MIDLHFYQVTFDFVIRVMTDKSRGFYVGISIAFL